MNQGREAYLEDNEIALRDYFVVLLRKWWVVTSVFVIILVVAIIFVRQMPDVYEARTKILIAAPVSERLITDRTNTDDRLPINPFLGTNLSVETLSALGTANDLLQKIITKLDLKNPNTGRPWAVEQLASMVNVSVETAGADGERTSLPLLTMTVRGGDPSTLRRIAVEWSNTFKEQNSQLFVTEAARSYDFVVNQYEDTEESLRAKEEEKLAFQQENSLPALESRLRILTAKYEDFLGQLQQNRSRLVEARAKLESSQEALLDEPQFVTLEQSIPSEALLVLLANNADSIDLERLPNLISSNQERNDLYFDLKAGIVEARSSVATLTSDIAYLETQTEELSAQIDELSSRIATTKLSLSRLDREINILTNNYNLLSQSLQETRIAKEEQAGFIQVVESAVVPSVPVGPDRQRFVLIAAVLGLILGIVMAFVVHYLQGTTEGSQKEERSTPSPDAPAS